NPGSPCGFRDSHFRYLVLVRLIPNERTTAHRLAVTHREENSPAGVQNASPRIRNNFFVPWLKAAEIAQKPLLVEPAEGDFIAGDKLADRDIGFRCAGSWGHGPSFCSRLRRSIPDVQYLEYAH